MTTRLVPWSVWVLVACGLPESKFAEKFGQRLCDEYETCNPDLVCDVPGDGDDGGLGDCLYDKSAARDCLDGDYVCNMNFGEGFGFVEVPSACADVYDCSDITRSDTDTDTDPTTTSGS